VKVYKNMLRVIRQDALFEVGRFKSLKSGNRPTLPQSGNEDVVLYELHSDDVKR